MARRLASVVVVVVAVAALLGCSSFEFDIPPASHINGTYSADWLARQSAIGPPIYPSLGVVVSY